MAGDEIKLSKIANLPFHLTRINDQLRFTQEYTLSYPDNVCSNQLRLEFPYYNSNMLLTLICILTVIETQALTGSQASSYCHCNLTPSFCDFDCCCDTDCTSVVMMRLRVYPQNASTQGATPTAPTPPSSHDSNHPISTRKAASITIHRARSLMK